MAHRSNRPRRPASMRADTRPSVDGCWDPTSGENTRRIKVNGERALELKRRGVPHWEAVKNVPATLREPSSVFESADKRSHVYFKRLSELPAVAPDVQRSNPLQVFWVRVSVPDDGEARDPAHSPDYAYVWDYEDADPVDRGLPRDRSPDRLGEQVS